MFECTVKIKKFESHKAKSVGLTGTWEIRQQKEEAKEKARIKKQYERIHTLKEEE